jgi:Flp pilus assembly pilin Flp
LALSSSTESHEIIQMSWLVRAARRLQRDEIGASLVEYALMLALITIVCIAGMTLLGTKINSFMSSLSSTV